MVTWILLFVVVWIMLGLLACYLNGRVIQDADDEAFFIAFPLGPLAVLVLTAAYLLQLGKHHRESH